MSYQLHNTEVDIYQTRQTLLDRVKNRHDERSWDEFVRTYRVYVYSICRRMNLSHDDSEDVLQQVLLKLWNRLSGFSYDDRRSFRAWLGLVTRNTANDFLRKQSRRSKTLENSEVNHASIPLVSESDVTRIAEEEWKKYTVTLAIERIRNQFPPNAINAFLALFRGIARQQVAVTYNLTADSVSAYKGRVLSALCLEIRQIEEELL